MRQGMGKKVPRWTHRSGLQPSNWHPSCSSLSRRWEGFRLTLIKLSRHIINEPVYYFLVRCRTFTMQTEYLCQHEEHFLLWGSYTENQVIRFPDNPNKGRLILSYGSSINPEHTFPTGRQPSTGEVADSCLLILLWLRTAVIFYSFTTGPLGLRVTALLTGFYYYLRYWGLRFWRGHISCSHVPTTRHNKSC